MRLALYQPDIPQNTGTLLRTCACLGVSVDVIGPTGFDMSDRALKRAGLDYLDHVDLQRHVGWGAFLASQAARGGSRLILLSSHAEPSLYDFAFRAEDTLMLGRESAGVPDHVRDACNASVRIPIREGLRSLNVAVAGAIALSEAMRQTGGSAGG
jgi:tRNA (cytidine/uridine-2'-O-)-methyltransferase